LRDNLERRCGWRLEGSLLDFGFTTACAGDFSKTLLVHPTENEYSSLFRVGVREGGGKRRRSSVPMLPAKVGGSLTVTSPFHMGFGKGCMDRYRNKNM